MNNVSLIGRVVRDPELRYSGQGMAVGQFTIAVDKGMAKDKKAECVANGKPVADFIRIVTFGKQAEFSANNLRKGARVAVNGSISVSTYKTDKSETRYTTDVLANNIEIIDWPEKENSSAPQKATTFDDDFANDFRAVDDGEDLPW
jgi:single-strand DNA-binding protein